MTGKIEIVDQEPAHAFVFRVIRREGSACVKSLACRVQLSAHGDFEVSFYGPHCLDDARHNRKPLTGIAIDQIELATAALREAKRISDEYFAKDAR